MRFPPNGKRIAPASHHLDNEQWQRTCESFACKTSNDEIVGVLDQQLPRGVPEVDECGLAEIGNSKEETRGTQFRQVRAARCVIPYVLYAA
jgi:hypothetical protein